LVVPWAALGEVVVPAALLLGSAWLGSKVAEISPPMAECGGDAECAGGMTYARLVNEELNKREEPTERVPNPYGKKGGPAHQEKVDEVARDIEARGLKAEKEFKVDTPEGSKSKRFVDVVGKDVEGNVKEMHQVGKQNKDGTPVARERKAIKEIKDASKHEPTFHPYNDTPPL
jgi:hypothetical protein